MVKYMYNIMFVCYGNICRSPMAEMIFKDLVYKNNKKFLFNCVSCATSMEEYGNDIYPKAKEVLEKNNITIERHVANTVKKDDYEKYDYIICMEQSNYYDLINIFNGDKDDKIKLLMSFTGNEVDIEDPWYTDNFDKVYGMIKDGCEALFKYLVDIYENKVNNEN